MFLTNCNLICVTFTQVLRWFQEEEDLPVCRVKNKFARTAETEDGYRDLSLAVLYQGTNGLAVIGEVCLLSFPSKKAVQVDFKYFLQVKAVWYC